MMVRVGLAAVVILALLVAVSAGAGDCYLCSLPTSKEHDSAGGDDPCEDLYAATCLDKSGKRKFEGAAAKIDEKMADVIDDARNKTARDWGFKDFSDAVRQKLGKEGFTILDAPDEDEWAAFQTGQIDKNLEVERIFKDSKECHEKQTEIQRGGSAEAKASFEKKYGDLIVHAQAYEFANFFNVEIAEKCKAFKDAIKTYPPNQNARVAEVCSNHPDKLIKTALDLFRRSNDANNKADVEKFVSAYQLPPLRRYDGDVEDQRSLCGRFDEVLRISAGNSLSEISRRVVKGKTTIDTLLDQFYTDANKKMAEDIFNVVKSDAVAVALKITKDPAKQKTIVDHYDHLTLNWLKKPGVDAYETDLQGHLILNDAVLTDNDFGAKFNDASLNYFRELNAEYSTRSSQGVTVTEANVDFQPAFLYFLKDHPYWAFGTAAHEVGHGVGPAQSKDNGFDLAPELENLLCCFSQSSSIFMQNNQKEEVMGDYVSGEILAIEARKVPKKNRAAAIMTAMEGFCIDADESGMTINPKEDHPESMLRLMGIVGANPRIRELLGCKRPDSKNVKTCAIDRPVKCDPKRAWPVDRHDVFYQRDEHGDEEAK